MTLNHSRLFQGLKYAVYAFLALNIYWFFIEEFAAAELQFPNGVGFANLIEAYAATIDTAAWVVLLLMFELETFVLEDHHFTKTVKLALQFVRIVCYVLIISAFNGYLDNLTFFDDVMPLLGSSDLCDLAGNWSYAVDLDEYTAVTAANCGSFSTHTQFFQFPEMRAVVDADGLFEIKALAWVDVINAGVWLLVVMVLEADVRLQEKNLLTGTVLRLSNALKVVLYFTLFLAAIYWGIKGDFVDFWDAFLWLVAFFFIELNVAEWRNEAQASGQNL